MQALAIAGGIVGTISSVQSLNYQAAVAKVNAQQMRLNAESAQEAAGKDVEDIGKQGAGEAGTLIANQGASGVSLSSPSFTSGIQSFLGRNYDTAIRRQDEGNQQSAAYLTEASIYDAEAKNAKGAIPLTIVGGIVNTAMSMSTKGGNLFASAKPTEASPAPASLGTIPTPRMRPRLSYGVVSRGR